MCSLLTATGEEVNSAGSVVAVMQLNIQVWKKNGKELEVIEIKIQWNGQRIGRSELK